MMMQTPLVLTDMLKRAETYYAHKEIISRTSQAKVHRLTYGEWVPRTAETPRTVEGIRPRSKGIQG